MGQSKDEPLSFWAPKFALVFRDYNGDGSIDFNLGQYSMCEGNDYWLFTIDKRGAVAPLPIDGEMKWIFLQDPRHINSTDKIELDNGYLKNTIYERSEEIEYTTWYRWTHGKFEVVKHRKVSTKEH